VIPGSDVLRVTEIQQYERVGNCFTVKSNPTSDAAAADVFSTKGRIVLSPTEDGKSCAILINVVLEFKTAVWGLQGICFLSWCFYLFVLFLVFFTFLCVQTPLLLLNQ
jgi:hypothetical protein